MKSRIRSNIFLLILTTVFVNEIQGQVKFNVTPRIEGIFVIDRVFQFSLINLNPTEIAEGYINIKVQVIGGEVVSQYKSLPLKVKATEPIFGSNIEWLNSIEYSASKSAAQLKDLGTLPYGNYSICYTFIGTKIKSSVYCTEVKSAPQLPPQLLNPPHTSVVNNTTPLLAWIPPMPDLNLNYLYSVKLVELRDNQTCVQALQQNVPIVQERNFDGMQYQVTDINGLNLEFGKNYCWQVGAYYKKNLLANTEIWQFKVDSSKIATPSVEDGMPFYYVKQSLDAENLKVKQFIKIAFDNRLNSPNLRYSIRSEDGKEEVSLEQKAINLNAGINQISLDCKTMKNLKTNVPYIIEVYDENDNRYYCRFTYESK